jgi:hypothetical protein
VKRLIFLATVLPRNIGMPDTVFYKLLFRSRNYAQHRITRREKQQPTALRVDATGLAYRPVAYRPTRTTAIRIEWPVTAHGRYEQLSITANSSLSRICSIAAIGFECRSEATIDTRSYSFTIWRAAVTRTRQNQTIFHRAGNAPKASWGGLRTDNQRLKGAVLRGFTYRARLTEDWPSLAILIAT